MNVHLTIKRSNTYRKKSYDRSSNVRQLTFALNVRRSIACNLFPQPFEHSTQIAKWSFGAHDQSRTFDRRSFYDRSCSGWVRNIKWQTKELMYICLHIIWSIDVIICDFYMFISYNIDVGVVRWPPAQSCGHAWRYSVAIYLCGCVKNVCSNAVLRSGFRDTLSAHHHSLNSRCAVTMPPKKFVGTIRRFAKPPTDVSCCDGQKWYSLVPTQV